MAQFTHLISLLLLISALHRSTTAVPHTQKRSPRHPTTETIRPDHHRLVTRTEHVTTGADIKTVGKSEDCTKQTTQCSHDLVCAGNATRKRCVKPRKQGKKCGQTAFRVCDEGLRCENNMCKSASEPDGTARQVANGETCDARLTICLDGSVCTRTYKPSGMVCVRRRRAGQICRYHPFARCAEGLVCVAGRCELEGSGSY